MPYSQMVGPADRRRQLVQKLYRGGSSQPFGGMSRSAAGRGLRLFGGQNPGNPAGRSAQALNSLVQALAGYGPASRANENAVGPQGPGPQAPRMAPQIPSSPATGPQYNAPVDLAPTPTPTPTAPAPSGTISPSGYSGATQDPYTAPYADPFVQQQMSAAGQDPNTAIYAGMASQPGGGGVFGGTSSDLQNILLRLSRLASYGVE